MPAVPVTDLALAQGSPVPARSGGATVAVDRSAAVDRLPGSDHQDPYQRLAMAFLVGCPANSARAYLVTSRPEAPEAQLPVRFAACARGNLQSETTSFILATLPRTAEATGAPWRERKVEWLFALGSAKSSYVSAAGRRV